MIWSSVSSGCLRPRTCLNSTSCPSGPSRQQGQIPAGRRMAAAPRQKLTQVRSMMIEHWPSPVDSAGTWTGSRGIEYRREPGIVWCRPSVADLPLVAVDIVTSRDAIRSR
jgi:hypothetical protein